MGKGRVLNKEIIKLTRRANEFSIDPGIRIAINNLQNQIAGLRASIYGDATDSDSEGNAGMAPPPISTIMLTNKSGAARNLGELVTLSAANENAFTVTTTQNDEAVIGVVASDSPDGVADAVAANAEGLICVAGKTLAKVISPVNVGDPLIAADTAGYAIAARSPFDPGIFAVAAEEILASSGLIEVIIEINNRFGNFADLQPYDERIVYDTDGSVTGFSGYLLSTAHWRTSALLAFIEHRIYFYDLSGLLCSATLSYFDVAGNGVSSLHYTLLYSAGNLDRMIQELS
jgi:hypothetical protein